jgi:hypothetical protein
MCTTNSNAYIKKMTTYFVIIAIHLDDTIVANNNLELVSNIETNVTKVYDMTLLDDIQFIFEIIRN